MLFVQFDSCRCLVITDFHFFLFFSFVYFFSFFLIHTVVLDWNTTLALPQRKKNNFFTPCYYLAFPPYRSTRMHSTTANIIDSSMGQGLTKSTCPLAFYSSQPGGSHVPITGILLIPLRASIRVTAIFLPPANAR